MEAHLIDAVKKLVKEMHEDGSGFINKPGETSHGDSSETQVDIHGENRPSGEDLVSSQHPTPATSVQSQSEIMENPDPNDKLQTDRSPTELAENNETLPFEQVQKELEMLNTQSQPRLYTGPYGRIQSPFKKFSSFRTSPRGVKRSPRKLSMPRSKKVKLPSDLDLLADSSSECESESSPDGNKIVDNPLVLAGPSSKPDHPSYNLKGDEPEDSDTSEEEWQIMEDSEPDIDKKIDVKSSKYSLSAINVKSIIHKIVTNEKVVEMVRRAVLEQVEEQNLDYEPKMTRSKAKEALETHGDIPLPLGLSPRKKTHDKSKFLDIDLPEDEEDDEDFNPFKQVPDRQWNNDDDSESITSSGFSDCDTTSMPSTPTTPTDQSGLVFRSLNTPTNADNENSNSFLSPMGPPLQNFVPRSHHKSSSNLGQKYRDAIEKDEQAKREEEELIASRTRSKYPLKEVSMLDIEANFVAPDITEDLYDTICDDEDWNGFLKTLIVFDKDINEDTNETGGEEEDPEFNFLEEAKNDMYDREDFRNDRGVKVSKKELNLLIDELNEAYTEQDPIDIDIMNMIKTQSETIVVAQSQKRSFNNPQNLVYEVSEWERKQIADQLRKHVQLLTQTYVLGMGDMEEHKHSIEASKMFLSELKIFSESSQNQYPDTMYNVCNLPAAMSVITDSIWTDTVEPAPEERERLDSLVYKYENQKLPSLNYKQLKVLWTSPAFMYPELLPHGGFFKLMELKKDRLRVKFIEAEDNLLAMGMDQFNHLPNGKEYIHNFMLPSKTKKQIQIRIKNLSTKTAKSNAVKYWKEHKTLPKFPQSAPFFNPCLMKACKDRSISILEFPAWAVFFRPEDAAELKNDMHNSTRSKKYLTFSVNPSDMSQLVFVKGSQSVPDTPEQSAGSSNVTSSSSSGSSCNNSKPALNRTRKLPRKKLDLGKGKKQPVPAFIPLTFSGKVKSISPSLTTSCLLDNTTDARLTSTDTSVISSPIITVSTTATPTVAGMLSLPSILVMDSNIQVQAAGLLSNVVLSTNAVQGDVINSDGKTHVLSDQTVDKNSDQCVSSGSVNVGLNSLNVNAGITTNNAINRTVVLNTMATQDVCTIHVTSDQAMDSLPVSIETDIQSNTSLQQNTQSNTSNNIIVSMPLLTSDVSTSCSSPLSMLGNVTSSVLNSNNSATQMVTTTAGTASPACSDGSTPHHDAHLCTPDRVSTNSTPTRNSMMSPSSEGESPKNALEIIASYAPYLLSPSPNRHNQKLLETTPKKRSGFIKLAPKPTPPDFNPSPSVSLRVPKVKSSPRRQRLNEQAKAILPKGFVVRSIDVSPSKKAASSLIEKAKNPGRNSKSRSFYFSSSSGYCKILPHPESPKKHRYEVSSVTANRTDNGNLSVKSLNRDTSLSGGNGSSKSDRYTKTGINKRDDNKENVDVRVKDKTERLGESEDGQNMDIDLDEDEDKTVDTESDYTQSEDGNDTQEELDSQEEIDSQEDDDNHIANLMQASTTTRFDPSKEDASKSHLGKKDRDRDTTLAMLAPDVITSDPQRDMRDTAYAQAYLHKVKKVLRDDMDKLERFLHLMFNFGKTKESPVELYSELGSLFKGHPGLIHDFAGFLLQDQAIECGCYEAFEEFNSARSFLRKLELYFSKTPYHFQRIIKTFSRWYRKPGRSTKDLKNEVEPMLKGHKYLLEEFSKFFPEEQPPDSAMDDFEEINLEGSEDELKYDSFEEIELFEGEEILGTKRCTCLCHESKDDTFRKKKKHCYRCCLTVIDGELVYRVNKSTIKKINITFGPSVKASSILTLDADDGPNSDNKQAEVMKPIEIDTEVETQSEGGEELMQVDREPADLDSGCVVDSDGLEKDVTIDGPGIGEDTEDREKVKSTDDVSKQNSSGVNTAVTATLSSSKGSADMDQSSDSTHLKQETEVNKESEKSAKVTLSVASSGDSTGLTEVSSSQVLTVSTDPPLGISGNVLLSENYNVSINEAINQPTNTNKLDNVKIVSNDYLKDGLNSNSSKSGDNSESGLNDPQRGISDISNASKASSETALANDILAAAFNAALMSEVSLDSSVFPFPLATKSSQGKQTKGITAGDKLGQIDQTSHQSTPSDQDLTCKPVALQDTTRSQTVHEHPSGQSQLSISSNSSFTKVISSSGVESVPEIDPIIQLGESDSSQPFSPFSPFGQEIQSITNAKNLASSKVPTKIRRITPIPVRFSSEDDQSFQSVVQNSPVITDMVQSPLAQLVSEKSTSIVDSSNINKVPSEGSCQSFSVPFTDFGSNSSKSLEFTSQKSAGAASGSQKSDCSEISLSTAFTGENTTFSALKISQPNLFSEDANVAFTRTSELTSMTTTISDDSLLQCLAKPPHFNDTIGSVSNLTNILNALDEKTSHVKSLEPQEILGKEVGEDKKSMDTLKESNSNGFPLENVPQPYKDSTVSVEGNIRETFTPSVPARLHVSDKDTGKKPMCAEKGSVSSDSSDSIQNTDTQYVYFPQSTQSIENLDRIKTGLFRVTSLSDSESSGIPTPSNSLTQVVSNNDNFTQGKGVLADIHSANTLVVVQEHSVKNNIAESKVIGCVQEPDTSKSNAPDKDVESSERMYKRHVETESSKHQQSTDTIHDPRGSVRLVDCSNSEVLNDTDNDKLPLEPITNTTLRNIVDEVVLNEPKDSSVNLNVNSTINQTDVTVSGGESGKQEKGKKKKRREGQESNSSTHKKKKKKRSKEKKLGEEVIDSPDASSQDSELGAEQFVGLQKKDLESNLTVSVGAEICSGSDYSPTGSAPLQSPGMMSTYSSGPSSVQSPGQVSLHSPAPSSCSSTGAADEDPLWTKETDKVILEKCKSHGVKEKTFVRIAKRLGDVTPKQVRKRFSHLYQLIFGTQVSSEAGQDTNSSKT